MSRPDKFPDWATDATYSSGPDSGLPTKLEPTSGEKASGYIRGQRPPARKMNWQLGKIGDWVRYLDEQHDIAARACLIEQKGTINAIWASAPCIAWDAASNAFLTVSNTHDLKFFSGANTSVSDASLPPSTTGTSTNIRVATSDAGTVWLARGASVSTANRLCRWLKLTGSWTAVTGAFPSGTALPFILWVTGTTFLAFDGSNCYEINGTAATARTSPGNAPNIGASNGVVTVTAIYNTAGSIRTTANNGATWTTPTIPGGNFDVASIVWYPRLGVFVATALNTFPIAISPDGINWTRDNITLVQQRGITGGAPSHLAVTAGGQMLVGFRAESTGAGEYANPRSLMYSFDAFTWRVWDFRAGGDAPIGIASAPSQVAVLYPGGVARLFGAG